MIWAENQQQIIWSIVHMIAIAMMDVKALPDLGLEPIGVNIRMSGQPCPVVIFGISGHSLFLTVFVRSCPDGCYWRSRRTYCLLWRMVDSSLEPHHDKAIHASLLGFR